METVTVCAAGSVWPNVSLSVGATVTVYVLFGSSAYGSIAMVEASSPGMTRFLTLAGAGETVIAAAIVVESSGLLNPMTGSPFWNRPPVPGVGWGEREREGTVRMDTAVELLRARNVAFRRRDARSDRDGVRRIVFRSLAGVTS